MITRTTLLAMLACAALGTTQLSVRAQSGQYFEPELDAHTVEFLQPDAPSAIGLRSTLNRGFVPVIAGDIAYFTGGWSNLSDGTEMWRTDGKPGGTWLLRDSAHDSFTGKAQAVAFGKKLLYFGGDSRPRVSDGTRAGTQLLSAEKGSNEIQVAGDRAFVQMYPAGTLGPGEIWVTDGTPGGTSTTGLTGTLLSTTDSIVIYRTGSFPNCRLHRFKAASTASFDSETISQECVHEGSSSVKKRSGPELTYFGAYTISIGAELWRTNGTTSGTFLLRAFNQNLQQTPIQALYVDGQDRAFFSANDNVHGTELWWSAGTTATTQLLADLTPGSGSSNPDEFAEWNGSLYFVAAGQLWRSNLASATPGPPTRIELPFAVSGIRSLVGARAYLFFLGKNDSTDEVGLYRTDGTTAGSVLVKAFKLYNYISDPSNYKIARMGNGVIFAAYEDGSGIEPWFSDGTAAGTRILYDTPQLPPGAEQFDSWIAPLPTHLGYMTWGHRAPTNTLFSGAGASYQPIAQFRSDGDTTSQAQQLNGVMYFASSPHIAGPVEGENVELWRSDGTQAGTHMLVDINPGLASSWPKNLTLSGDRVYFEARTATRRELWRSSGTSESTYKVTDMFTTSLVSSFMSMTPDGAGGLYFIHNESFAHTTGTASGTRVILPKPDWGGSGQRRVWRILGRNGSTVFLEGGDGIANTGIVVSDGTNAGTRVLRRPASGHNVSFARNSPGPKDTAILGNYLYFVGETAQHGSELWRTDGTVDGTELVKDIAIGPQSSFPHEMTVHDGMLYFSAEDHNAQHTLWRSDGTTAGTSAVVTGDGAPVKPRDLVVVDGKLYFVASDRGGQYGYELWRSDAMGTRMLQDILPGPASSEPESLTAFNGRLYVVAQHPTVGRELLSAPIDVAGPTPTPGPTLTPSPSLSPTPGPSPTAGLSPTILPPLNQRTFLPAITRE